MAHLYSMLLQARLLNSIYHLNISNNGSLLAKYLYLADGMKTSAQHSDGSGLVFRGPFVYGRSSAGTLAFGRAACARS